MGQAPGVFALTTLTASNLFLTAADLVPHIDRRRDWAWAARSENNLSWLVRARQGDALESATYYARLAIV